MVVSLNYTLLFYELQFNHIVPNILRSVVILDSVVQRSYHRYPGFGTWMFVHVMVTGTGVQTEGGTPR